MVIGFFEFNVSAKSGIRRYQASRTRGDRRCLPAPHARWARHFWRRYRDTDMKATSKIDGPRGMTGPGLGSEIVLLTICHTYVTR